jgi:glycosyltransferase involved in cell wall biosynthesis
MEKLLTIIIPVYNGESYLKRCLESIYLQVEDRDWFEVIVVDDGSTDNSSHIVQDGKKKFENLFMQQQENLGVSEARNAGLQKSKGLFICFLDVDDILASGGLDAFLMFDKANIDLFLLDSFTNSEKGRVLRYAFPSKNDKVILSGLEMAKFYDRASVAGVLFRREFLISNRIFFAPGLSNGEDLLFLAHSFIYAQRVVHMPIAFYEVHRTKNSASQKWCFQRLITNLEISINWLKKIREDESINNAQVALINLTAYRVFSYAAWFLIKTKKISGFLKFRAIIKESSFWPIPLSEIGDKKLKIRLFNLSIVLFFLMIMIRNRKQ